MQVHQNLTTLFYRKRKKADQEGFIPIYCRITIDARTMNIYRPKGAESSMGHKHQTGAVYKCFLQSL